MSGTINSIGPRRGCRAKLAMDPVPPFRFARRFAGKLAAGKRADDRLLQRDRKRPAGKNLHPLRPPREHVQQHPQVNRLADAAGSQHGHHLRPNLLRLRLMRQRHRHRAMPATFGVERVAFVADIAGHRHRIFGKPIGVERH